MERLEVSDVGGSWSLGALTALKVKFEVKFAHWGRDDRFWCCWGGCDVIGVRELGQSDEGWMAGSYR